MLRSLMNSHEVSDEFSRSLMKLHEVSDEEFREGLRQKY
jgi:hypothetical protein